MSVRIYSLSKEVGMSNKEVITLLQERGLQVDSPSNTIPNIYADSFIEEFKQKKKSSPGKAAPAKTEKESKNDNKSTQTPESPKPPLGKFVRSKEEIDKEKQEAEAAKQRATVKMPAPPAPKSAPSPMPIAPPKPPERPTISIESAPTLPGAKFPPLPPKIPGVLPPKIPGIRPTAASPAPVGPRPPILHQQPKPAAPVPPKASPAPAIIPQQAPKLPPQTSSPQALPSVKKEGVPQPTQAKGEPQVLHCKPPIVVREFANLLDIKPFRLISELMDLGIFASMNQTIEEEIAVKIAKKHGFILEVHHRGEQQQQQQIQQVTPKKKEEPKIDESKLLEPRAPVVCVLGHVDHGKTTLLDTIRKANVVKGEAGGITQHIGAYQVEHNGHKITFIDTPGHAAFSKMRERGANVTDIAILVVAADDTFMPQTDEALKFAQKANVPIVVAINKMDAKGANPDRVKQQMQERNLAPEDWGGDTLCAQVSALKGDGIPDLLDLILLQAEMEELKANPKCNAEGVVLESQIETGMGPTATVIIQKGTLKVGDALVCGGCFCKVRAMLDDKGARVKTAEPSKPVKVMGWSDTPDAGAEFRTVKNERDAKREADDFAHQEKLRFDQEKAAESKMDLEKLFSAIAETQNKTLKVIIKGDVHGSVEALKACLEGIDSKKVTLDVIQAEVGPITKNDVTLAHSGNATIVGFNTKLDNGVQAQAKHDNVRILQHNIIYELITQVKEAMSELLDPELKENKLGAAEIRQVFDLTKATIAGCMVTEGRITRDGFARVLRGKKQENIHQGSIGTLKRFKEDVSEVRAGYECGIQINGFDKYEAGDIIECFEIIKIRPSL